VRVSSQTSEEDICAGEGRGVGDGGETIQQSKQRST